MRCPGQPHPGAVCARERRVCRSRGAAHARSARAGIAGAAGGVAPCVEHAGHCLSRHGSIRGRDQSVSRERRGLRTVRPSRSSATEPFDSRERVSRSRLLRRCGRQHGGSGCCARNAHHAARMGRGVFQHRTIGSGPGQRVRSGTGSGTLRRRCAAIGTLAPQSERADGTCGSPPEQGSARVSLAAR